MVVNDEEGPDPKATTPTLPEEFVGLHRLVEIGHLPQGEYDRMIGNWKKRMEKQAARQQGPLLPASQYQACMIRVRDGAATYEQFASDVAPVIYVMFQRRAGNRTRGVIERFSKEQLDKGLVGDDSLKTKTRRTRRKITDPVALQKRKDALDKARVARAALRAARAPFQEAAPTEQAPAAAARNGPTNRRRTRSRA